MSPDFLMTLKLNCISSVKCFGMVSSEGITSGYSDGAQGEPYYLFTEKRQKKRHVSELPLRYLHFVPLTFAAQDEGCAAVWRCFHMHQCPAFGSNLSLRCAGTDRILLHHTKKPVKVK